MSFRAYNIFFLKLTHGRCLKTLTSPELCVYSPVSNMDLYVETVFGAGISSGIKLEREGRRRPQLLTFSLFLSTLSKSTVEASKFKTK